MSLGESVVRKLGAMVFLPNENEWYKAAYYKGGGTDAGYWDYPTQSDSIPSNDLVAPDPGNNANFRQDGYTIGSPYWMTEVGEFENSDSAYGTYDQGGNVWEWNESVITGSIRGLRGSSFRYEYAYLHAGFRNDKSSPMYEGSRVGFRVASKIPEPSTLLLGSLAAVGMLMRRPRL